MTSITLTASSRTTRRKPARYHSHSYALEGEDLILAECFHYRRNGFFVDVGAHHPKRFSNTYHFYRYRGWRGINIDAMPGSMRAFRRSRPEDVNVESAVAETAGAVEFFMFDEPALNTCDAELATFRQQSEGFKLLRQVSVEARPLRDLLRQHVPAGKRIDLLTVDVEGLDLAVLRSNDWQAYRPAVVAVEDLAGRRLREIGTSPTTLLLEPWGYEPFASTARTVLYRLSESADAER